VSAQNQPPEYSPKKIEPVYLTPAAFQLILDFEVGGGEVYYNRKFARPTWPGGDSGVTIGVGYDIGNNSLEQFMGDWKSRIPDWPFQLLRTCVGIRGPVAKERLPLLTSVNIPWESALAVYRSCTIPRFYTWTASLYPGLEKLPGDAQGALVSLVYNRGGNMEGDRRREMREIRDAVARQDLRAIAQNLRDMKRIWVGQGLDGLIARREAEARLVESAI
jgi:hypothetical protein